MTIRLISAKGFDGVFFYSYGGKLSAHLLFGDQVNKDDVDGIIMGEPFEEEFNPNFYFNHTYESPRMKKDDLRFQFRIDSIKEHKGKKSLKTPVISCQDNGCSGA